VRQPIWQEPDLVR